MLRHSHPFSQSDPQGQRNKGLCVLALLTQLAACSVVGPVFQKPQVDAPKQWTQIVSASPLPADRWAAFHDPRLLRLQLLAMHANSDVKVAALRLMQSRVSETTVSAKRGPKLDARGGVSRQRQSESGGATRVAGAVGEGNQQQLITVMSEPFAQYQAGFDASWEPDVWGRIARSEESAKATSEGQQALLRQVQLSVVAEVARQYFQLRSVQDQSRLVRQQLTTAREMEQILAAQRLGGMADESVLIKQRSLVAGLEALIPTLTAQEIRGVNQIALLCGEKPGELPDELVASDPNAIGTQETQLPDLRVGIPSELVRNRPDLTAAEAALHAATANIGLAMSDLYPRITIGASFGLETISADKFGDWGSRQWSVGPSLSIPLFDQGRRRSVVTLRELQQQESAVAYQQAVLKAWHEVDDAISNYVGETGRSTALMQKVGFAKEDAKLAQARFASGMTSYLPVATVKIALLEAQRDFTEQRARLNIALTVLYKALGDDVGAQTEEKSVQRQASSQTHPTIRKTAN